MFNDGSNEFEGKKVEIASERERGRSGRIGGHVRIGTALGSESSQLLLQGVSTLSKGMVRSEGKSGDEEERELETNLGIARSAPEGSFTILEAD